VQVHQRVRTVLVVHDRPRHLAHVVAARRLDLDHVGAEVDEVPTERARPEHRQVEHPHAFEETAHA
jgi:hypothetical protein